MNRRSPASQSTLPILFLLGSVSFANADASGGFPTETIPDEAITSDGVIETDQPTNTSQAQRTWSTFKSQLNERYNFRFSIHYNMAYLAATESLGEKEAASATFELNGAWTIPGPESADLGLIGFRVEDRHKYWTVIPPAKLGPEIGSLWRPNILFSEFEVTVSQLWWEKHFDDHRYVVRLGKLISPVLLYDPCILRIPQFSFENAALLMSGIAYPSNGLGVLGAVMLGESAYIKAGIHDANGRPTEWGFDTFFDVREYFTAAEAGWVSGYGKRNLEGWISGDHRQGLNNTRLVLWHMDEREARGLPEGWGFTVSHQRFIGEKWMPFARYSYSSSRLTPTRHLASAGFGRRFRERDIFGVGASWGEPSDDALEDQIGVESFYLAYVNENLSVIPTVHLIANPSLNPNTSFIAVGGMRARLSF